MAKKAKTTKKKSTRTASYKMVGVHVPDWPEIKSYFTNIDRQHMLAQSRRSIDLHDCKSVVKNAAGIFSKVSSGQMPPGNPWGPDKINGFYSWWKSNPKCPS